MRQPDTPAPAPSQDRRGVGEAVDRARRWFDSTPLPLRILLAVLACLIGICVAPFYAPYAVWKGRRTLIATASVAVWGIALFAAHTHGPLAPRVALIVLPLLIAGIAHLGVLGRWFVPCRTAAWALLWVVPVGSIAYALLASQQFIAPSFAYLTAFVVLGWRFAKSLQETRAYGPQQARAGAGAPGWSPPPPRPAAGRPAVPAQRSGRPPADRRPPGARPPDPRLAMAAEAVRGQPGEPARARAAEAAATRAATDWPEITVDEAMAELDSMIGLEEVKEQVRSIAASIEAARRRALAGHSSEKPMQHFVFLGPPGTGKTAVARILAKIFYAFGLLDTPEVREAQRADLVGEYLGATAIKTNELVDSALGGVLFIDEAYSLVNEGDGQGDRFGNEAVQTLLKRAEDDRQELVIILAGYERQMEAFLATNPGLASRFANRVKFPGYTPAELLALADLALERRGEVLDPDARPALWRMFEDVGRRRIADDLGNGRFVRSLLDKAGRARDVRVMSLPEEPTSADLVTVRSADLEQAFADLTSRFRGYGATPTLESALAELDALVGLDPVKRQVREIAAQLRVARLRDRQGLASQPPARHFVFTGPPGTGKTTVARILGRIFAAQGLLVRPNVVEAHRADLVGEHLGSTAIKTNKLVDSALGGVLFIDEAYSLYNEGYTGGDAFGAEAVATLLKRAEDDRDRLVIVLAGYTADMDRFLRSNPGMASRFSVRISFPSYDTGQLVRIAAVISAQAGDSFAADAMPVLERIFADACAQGRIDELGNGRFARSLFERACASRDLRVARLGEEASAEDLTTVAAADLDVAYAELVR